MKINIVLPYEDVKKNIYIWANEEKHIDFRKEYQRAERCTVCFAATELEKYLRELGAYVFFSDKTEDTLFNIVLMPEKTYSDNDTFFIEPKKNGIKISSGSRTGILYGVYRLLKMQGIRWLNPDCDIIPDIKIDKLNIPAEKEKYMSDMPLGRGFDFEGALKDSTKLWLWMARNKLNLSTYRPYTAAFQRKLGMIFKKGGHIFEDILDPDRIGKEGKTFWDVRYG